MSVTAAIITAAGSGSRMGAPKQFLELRPGQRVIDRTILTCRSVVPWVGVIVPAGQCGEPWVGPPVDAIVDGSDSRYSSLRAGMAVVPPEVEVLVVHSASHPLATAGLIQRLIAEVEDGADGAVPHLAAVDVIKRRNPDRTLTTVGRERLGTAQAPMAWSRAALDRALASVDAALEESAAVEAIGGRVVAVDGELTNIHITDPASLAMARILAASHDSPDNAE